MFSWLRKFIVTREEYDALFLCCVRLTDRIEALETYLEGDYDGEAECTPDA